MSEDWDDEALLYWRTASWPDLDSCYGAAQPSQYRRLDGLEQALAIAPEHALEALDARGWMISVTEAHADALERLAILQEHQPDDGATDAAAEFRGVVRRHREEAARCLEQPAPMLSPARSAHYVAQLVVDQPQSVPAIVERNLNNEAGLVTFAAAVRRIEREHGEDCLRDALTALLFAKHHSRSWRITGHVRQARRSARHAARRLRRLASRRFGKHEGGLHAAAGPVDADSLESQSAHDRDQSLAPH